MVCAINDAYATVVRCTIVFAKSSGIFSFVVVDTACITKKTICVLIDKLQLNSVIMNP